MFKTTVKFGIRPIKIKSPTFSAQQMALLGTEGLKSVRERVMRGIGADDSPMPPLSSRAYPIRGPHGNFVRKGPPYRQWKPQHGLSSIRDLVGEGQGGHMLENFSVRSATENQVKLGLTSTKARIKALANEKRSPWLWWSENDQKRIIHYATQVFNAAVEVVRTRLRAAGYNVTWTKGGESSISFKRAA